MFKDELLFAWKTFKARKLRSWLTMIGVIIGIAAIVGLISLGQGLHDSVIEQFREIGTDKIFIQPGSGFGAARTNVVLDDDDIDTIKRVSGVKEAIGMSFTIDKIIFNDKEKYYWVSSWPTQEGIELASESFGAGLEGGRLFEKGEKHKAIIGWKLVTSDKYFSRKIRVGDKINIKGVKFEVIGYFESKGNDQDDTTIFIPDNSFEEIYGKKSYDIIVAQSKENIDSVILSEAIEKKLRKKRGLNEGEEDFTIQTFDQLLSSFGIVLIAINIVLMGIASISLIVGGIGIANTMFTSVLERRKEIGIMKAIGARNSNVMQIFLIESSLLGLTGGIIGIIIGVLFAKLAQYVLVNVFNFVVLQPSYPLWLFIGSLSFSIIVGIVGGVLPAVQASKLNPVEALRK